MIRNSQGTVYYGMHFMDGVATARPDPSKPEITVYLNSSTIRSMDKTFTARPVYVMHVDEVEQNIDELRKEVDGWVVESFYNAADGKHWAKFIVCSAKGQDAVNRGWRLSNCYMPRTYGPRGDWNGVKYDKEVTSGEYEHLAIVPNPRYAESVILTPEEFHSYNESQDREIELTRLANAKEVIPVAFKLKMFTRKKVENTADIDLDETIVVLPKSKKEVVLGVCVKNWDDMLMKKDEPTMANGDHLVDYGEEKLTVNALIERCQNLEAGALEDNEVEPGEEVAENDDDGDEDDDMDDTVDNEDDEEEEMPPKKKKDDKAENARPSPADKKTAKKTQAVTVKNARTPEEIKKAKDKAKKLANAREKFENDQEEEVGFETSTSQVARGRALFG